MANVPHNDPKQLPKTFGHYRKYMMRRGHFLDGTIACAPGPGQTPADISRGYPCNDWPKEKTLIRVPEVVIISIMVDPTVYSERMDVRYDYGNSVWGYPETPFNRIQTDFQALPYANYGVGRSFDGGVSFLGFEQMAPQITYFPSMFDVAYEGTMWPQETPPIRYHSGTAFNPEPSFNQQMIDAAMQVKSFIESIRPNRTWVQVNAFVPKTFNWQQSQFQENGPVLKFNLDGNMNIISPYFHGIVPEGTGSIAWGGWNDPFIQEQLGDFGHIIPPQDPWFTRQDQAQYLLPYADLDDPLNQMPFSFSGPAELAFPFPLPNDRPFFGCDVLHIYIGYRAWPRGPKFDESFLIGNLSVSATEDLHAGHSIKDVALAAAVGMENWVFRQSGLTTGDYLNNAISMMGAYKGHRTMVFGMPLNLSWNNTITFVDPREHEQFVYFYGGLETDPQFDPPGPWWVFNPSPFNNYTPDFFYGGQFTLLKPDNPVPVFFWYPLHERWPFNRFYTEPAVKLGTTMSLIQFLQAATEKMENYFSSTRLQFGDEFWKAMFEIYPQYAQAGVTYEGTAETLNTATLIGIIENHFGFKAP